MTKSIPAHIQETHPPTAATPAATGYAVNLAGRSRANVAILASLEMAQARARSEAKRNRQATEVWDLTARPRRMVYRVECGGK